MEKLTSLIYNYNCDCHKQYTKVSKYLGDQLDESLKDIEKFYYSDFWIQRFRRRLKEEGLLYRPIELDIIQGTSTELIEEIKFSLFDADPSQNGVSNSSNMIALNVNLDKNELNDSHINNVIMHEFGHRQYRQKEFKIIVKLNRKIIGEAKEYVKNSLTDKDYEYFTNHDELRQRIIPIIKEMRDNSWTLGETYDKSHNLEIDDIKNIFEREYILKLIDNLL